MNQPIPGLAFHVLQQERAMSITGYDAWKLAAPEHHTIGTEDGETCGRFEEPDDDAPRGYRPKPCAGIMETDANGDTCCNWCGEVVP